MAQVIGLLLGAITMIPMLESFIPDKTAQTTTIRIGAGTSTDSKASTSGNTPGVRLFDVVGRSIAQKSGSSSRIADGSFSDIKLVAPDSVGGRQGQYLSVVSGGNDALCISYIAVTWPDGGQQTWTGDIGVQCGGDWYESQTIMDPSTNYMPKCMWIDSDGSNGIKTKGMGIHITDFTPSDDRAAQYQKDPPSMCGSQPRFWLYDDIDMKTCMPYFDPPLQYTTGLTDMDRSKVVGVQGSKTCTNKKVRRGGTQAVSARRLELPSINNTTSVNNIGNKLSSFLGKLITSNSTSHSAIRLCDSETSLGPDFVAHHENTYCDMMNKQSYPLCGRDNSTISTDCFDIMSKTLVPSEGLKRRDTPLPTKEYHTVTHW
ncbi:hypothetical protein BELL_0616g00060 [Botrytis elliptica]|uniref:Uncharacterized protein n=1 Tax=Botrytis elliptica TaxID=278938 RepID=A0A4Z1JBM5_9HELO|nr:hypothetical protein BELL_0616g00060 [Botrytis elliptica]